MDIDDMDKFRYMGRWRVTYHFQIDPLLSNSGGKLKSLRNRGVDMKRGMNVEEATLVCLDYEVSQSNISFYPVRDFVLKHIPMYNHIKRTELLFFFCPTIFCCPKWARASFSFSFALQFTFSQLCTNCVLRVCVW